MTWARLDDSILTHPKVAGLSAGAGWLWVRALVYCNKHLTDGELVPAALKVLQARRRDLDELLAAGLLETAPGGYQIHDYSQWNETRASVLGARRAARLRADARATHPGLLLQSCAYCGGDGGTIDHIVPISRGGDNSPENLAASCRRCNSRKGAA